MRLLAAIEHVDQLPRQDLAVDGAEGREAGLRCGVRQGVGVHGPQIRQALGAQLVGHRRSRHFGGSMAEARPAQRRGRDHVGALGDRLGEQPASRRRSHQVHDAETARRLSGDRDIGRIASEGRDVALDPAQGRDLVEQAVVARDAVGRLRAQLGMSQIAQHAQAVVDRYDDDPPPGHGRPVVHAFAAGARDQGAAVDPDQDRGLLDLRGRPDVQRQAVLAHRHGRFGVDAARARPRLNAGRTELGRVADALPGRSFDGRPPAARPHRRRGVGHALEDLEAVLRHAAQRAGRRADDGLIGPGGNRRHRQDRDGQGDKPGSERNQDTPPITETPGDAAATSRRPWPT